MLSVFLKVPGVGDLTGIRDVICSGEALTKGQEEQFYRTFKTARLHNLYGPTEASIDVTYWACGKDSEKDSSVVPIGRPIANTQLYIVDQANNPCPPYVAGELLIGGVGLAKGYWNRPTLTSDKFIPNPFGPGRLYRTGDLARYRLDGTIEYLGRNDFQVKLRGLRIELGEIEEAIENHPGIDRAVVTLWRRSETDERLIGYYTCQDNTPDPAKEDLISLLKKTLPDYMIPSHFLWLEQMPINANGKLDRKALPLPEVKPLDSLILPPENDTQKTIHTLWKNILSGGDFGIDDNFFDVGGSSLTLMELGLKLEKVFERQINVLDLFRHPTIKGMATFFEQKSSSEMTDQKSRAQAQRERLKGLRSKRKDRSNIDK
jgi:acyl carrier protein